MDVILTAVRWYLAYPEVFLFRKSEKRHWYRPLVRTGWWSTCCSREHRDTASAEAFSRQAIERAGVVPEEVVTDHHQPVWSTGIATFAPPSLDAPGWIVGLGSLFQGLVVGTLTFSLGEEPGWRGYLLPKLVAALGPGRGMALTGFLHGLFHMPIICDSAPAASGLPA